MFQIPSPPKKENLFSKIIEKNNIKNLLINHSNITKIENETLLNTFDNKKQIIKKQVSPNKYISNELFLKIKEKEKINKIVNEINFYNYYYDNKKEICTLYSILLMQIKTKLLVNNGSFSLEEIASNLLESNNFINKYIKSIESMKKTIIFISYLFKNFISIKYSSLIGEVVVIENKNYEIPNIENIKMLIEKD